MGGECREAACSWKGCSSWMQRLVAFVGAFMCAMQVGEERRHVIGPLVVPPPRHRHEASSGSENARPGGLTGYHSINDSLIMRYLHLIVDARPRDSHFRTLQNVRAPQIPNRFR